MKEQLLKDFDNTIKNLSLSQKDIEIKKFTLILIKLIYLKILNIII